jgi:PAS domain S-box-containing protein
VKKLEVLMKSSDKTQPDRGVRKKKPSVHTTRVRQGGASPKPKASARGSGEAALRSSEEKFRQQFATAEDGILLLDAQKGDTTESRRAEAHLHKLNRTYAVLSEVNRTIVRVRGPQVLFDVACRIAVEKGGFLMAWIGLLDPQTKRVNPVAHAGKTDGYLEKLNITLDDSEHGRGPIATALRAGEHIVVNDIADDPSILTRADALLLGYRTMAAFPLIVAGEVRGTLNLYSSEPDVFNDDELKLLDEMAADIAFAMEFTEQEDQRRQAELLLRESQERFQTLAGISPVGIFRTDPNGATTYVNPKWGTISGLSFAQALGDGWLNAVHPDDKEDLSKGWQESTKLRKASFSDYRFVRPDGTVAWVMGQVVPEMNSENQLVGYVGTITDITERKRAEAALQASERQLSQIYASISDVLYYLAVEPDDRFRFISVNSAFLTATGLTEDQIIGKLVQEVIPEPAQALVLGNYKEAIRTKKAVGWEEVSVYPAGKKYGEVSVTPILDANGNCFRLIGIVHDITYRKHAEEEIRKLNADLEQRVKERTARLTAANKDLESFSYSVSHDLRAPLRAINGFASIISRRHRAELDEEGQHYVDNIVQASEQMGHLIDDLLNYSRLGREGIRHVPVSLASLMIEIRKNMQSRLEEIHGTIEIAEGLPTVIGDQTLLNQIFTNLLENAITFHKPDLPPIVAITWRIEDDQVIVQVSDNGIGIPAEYQDKIFIMFQRLHSEDEYPGTGIGLANVKKSVELLGGSVWVESKVGEGSTFFVRMPKE